MSDFLKAWELGRQRFDESLVGVSEDQLRFRPFDDVMTIGEMAVHLYGVEAYYLREMTGCELEPEIASVIEPSIEVVHDSYADSLLAKMEYSAETIRKLGILMHSKIARLLVNLDDSQRNTKFRSVLGPEIDGVGAAQRLCFHPGYHAAQVYIIKQFPNYPK